MKGPKGIGSFFPFIFKINNTIDIIAPSIKDRNIVRKMFLIPIINPREPINFTSPPPIQPLEIIIITINNRELNNSPPMLFNKPNDSPYLK